MDDEYGMERLEEWNRIFREVVSPIVISNITNLDILRFTSVENTQLDIEYGVDFFMVTKVQQIPIATRGRRHSYKDLTLRQLEYFKLSNVILRKKLGEKIEYSPELYFYYSVDDETRKICKTISIYKTCDIIETADRLRRERKLRWNKIRNGNPFAIISMYDINRTCKKNDDDLLRFEHDDYTFVCTSYLKDKETMVKNVGMKEYSLFL